MIELAKNIAAASYVIETAIAVIWIIGLILFWWINRR
jgi:uncharacterized membrane protein YciS (DUF1049 family)